MILVAVILVALQLISVAVQLILAHPAHICVYVWDPITNMRSIKHRKVHLNVTLNAGL